MALIVTLVLAFAFLIGILLGKFGQEERIEKISVSLSFGALIGVVLLDMIPEIVESTDSAKAFLFFFFFIFLGFVLLLILDRFVPEHEGSEKSAEGNMIHIGIMATSAIVIHNIVEGMSVYSVSSVVLKSGIILALGVALHNIPLGMLIYSTVKNEEKKKKYLVIILSSFSTFIGGLIMASLSRFITPVFVEALTSIALGMVLYILSMELLPSFRHFENKKKVLLWAIVGFLLVFVGSFLE